MVHFKAAFAIAIVTGLTLGAIAPNRLITAAAVPNPPVSDAPPGRAPAGTRGPCEETENTPFTPLLPLSDGDFSGTTLSSHPSFWFYVPYLPEQTSTGRFALVTEDGTQVVYRADVTLPTTPGFVKVEIPPTVPGLEVGSSYRWQFMIYCGAPDAIVGDPSLGTITPDFRLHRGSIQRIDESALTSPLATGDLTQEVRGLLENQVWYDAAADLEAIQAVPSLWSEVLRAIELEDLGDSELEHSLGTAELITE